MKKSELIKMKMEENQRKYEDSFKSLLDASNEEEQQRILDLRSSLNNEWYKLSGEYYKTLNEEEDTKEVEQISDIDLPRTLSNTQIEEVGQCLYVEFKQAVKALNIDIDNLTANDLAYIILEVTNRLKELLN